MSVTTKAIALLEAGVPSKDVPELAGASTAPKEFFLVWDFALKIGSPLREALNELSALENDSRAANFELQQSLALPRATKNLMLWLPILGLLLSQAFGLQPFSAFTNPLGVWVFGFAIALLAVGDRVAEKMISGLSNNADSALELLLLAVALRSGITLREAQELLPTSSNNSQARKEILQLGCETGAPISELLIAAARENREASTSRAIEQARALSVRLLVPLGLTVLPAFLLLTVVPVLISQLIR